MATVSSLNEQCNGPLVSVVMPVRDMEPFLEESINGILSQTFREFELIVVDFGSTDSSKAIAFRLAALDNRVRLHPVPSCTLAEARNAGCSCARGRYIAVQDADDVSLPERLMAEVEFMEKNPDAGLVGGIPEFVDVNGKSMRVPWFPINEDEIRSALLEDFPFCHTSLLIRKEAFERVGGYRPVMTQSHDYDLALRISEHYRCANLNQVLVKYRIHADQVSLSRSRRQTLCKLAAQASAASRRAKKPDLLNSIREITPDSLVSLGVTQAQQESGLAAGYQKWIESLASTGGYAAALKIALEAAQSRWEHLDRTRVAEFHFCVARLYWREGKSTKSFFASCRALWLQPAMAKRFLESLIWRLRHMQFRSRLIG